MFVLRVRYFADPNHIPVMLQYCDRIHKSVQKYLCVCLCIYINKLTSIIVELCSSLPANIIFISSGAIPIWGATISFKFFISHFGSNSTESVFPVFVLMYMLKELDILRLPNHNNCNILRNAFFTKLNQKLIVFAARSADREIWIRDLKNTRLG